MTSPDRSEEDGMRIDLGVSEDLPLVRQQELAAVVEEAGFGCLWTNEARGRDALLVCQAWALATEALEVGTAVVPLWTRSAAQLAMAAATVQDASGGRLRLGIGVSHPATMEPWHGVEFRRPLTAARETLEILDQLLAGETSGVEGEVRSSRRLQLAISPPPPRPPLYLAAMGPRMLALAGAVADGALLNWSTPGEVERAAGRIRDAAGDRHGVPEVAAYVRVAVHPDRGLARAALARELGRYCALSAYAEHLCRQGHDAAVEAMRSAYRRGGAEAVPEAVDDGVLLELGWYGTPEDDPQSALARYAGAGLDRLIARVVTVGGDVPGSIRAVVDALPPRVEPPARETGPA